MNVIDVLLPAMQLAGNEILAMQNANLKISNKQNNDIVTQADLAADRILRDQLLGHFPEYGWLSEESVDDLSRQQAQRVFIIDPIDGTREYATGVPEYAISVALVEDGVPIVAAIFNPATQELFHAIKGKGAWLNNQQIHCKSDSSASLTLLASRSEYRRGEWSQFETNHTVIQVGSIAYKLALIAAGKADATFSLGPKSEWDIAAGVLIVQEAGGFALNQQAEAFKFNNQDILVNGIVAANNTLKNTIFDLIS